MKLTLNELGELSNACFLGGGGSSAPPQTTSTVTTQELSPQQQQLLSLAIPVAEQHVANPPQYFPGTTTAPISPLELQAQQMGIDFANQFQGQTAPTVGGLNFLTSGAALSPDSNPYLRAAAEAAIRPLQETYSQQVLPGIRSDAISSGSLGGSRQGVAEGIASQALLRGVGDVSANIYNQAYQSGLDAMTRGLAFAPSIYGMGTLPIDVLSSIGGQNRAFEQAAIDEAVQRFNAEQLLPFLAAQDAANLAFGIGGGTSSSTSLVPGARQPSRLQSAISGGVTGAALGAPLNLGALGAVLGTAAGLFA